MVARVDAVAATVSYMSSYDHARTTILADADLLERRRRGSPSRARTTRTAVITAALEAYLGRARRGARPAVPRRRAEPHGRLSLDGRSIARREAGRRRHRPALTGARPWRSCSTRARPGRRRPGRPQPRRGGGLVPPRRRAAAAWRADAGRARRAAPARARASRRRLALVRSITGGGIRLVAPTDADLGRAAEHLEAAAEHRPRLADAVLVAIAERLGVRRIATFDRRPIAVFRPRHVRTFDLEP